MLGEMIGVAGRSLHADICYYFCIFLYFIIIDPRIVGQGTFFSVLVVFDSGGGLFVN